ncbi:MAG: Holliday junction resolvase RuvX [Thermoanaerobacterales bacterium]|nr:Holliday junction resolvase RuvX [Thermoanaerobacterales bacterium]
MRILGLDIGDKRIGVAISDELGITAQGVDIINRNGMKKDIDKILNMLEKYKVRRVVVGLPKNMNGTVGPQVKSVKNFIEKIRLQTDVEFVYWDERLTTIAAEKILIDADLSRKKRKGVVDKLAAVIILQNYLDYKSRVDT